MTYVSVAGRSRQSRVAANRDAFILAESLKSLPTFIGGSLELVFHALKQELNTIAEDSGSMEEMILAIQAAISVLGADELTGDMRAPSPPEKPSARKAAESAMAAIQPTIRGGGKSKGRGKGPAAQPTATVVQPIPAAQAERGPCLAGAGCPFFGTHTPCMQTHTKEEMDEMRKALGPNFVNADDRRNRQIQQVEAALHVKPVPDAAAGLVAALSRAESSASLLAKVRAAQRDHPQDGSVPSGAAVPSVPHFALSSVGRVPEKEPSGSIDASILPGYPPGQPPTTTINNFYITVPTGKSPHQAEHAASVQQSVSRHPTRGVIEDILQHLAPFCFGDFPADTAVTMLDACGHHAIPSTDLSHTVPSLPSQSPCEQPVGAATSLIPAAYTESINMPARTIGDPNTIIMPPIRAAALTSTIRAIPMATGPNRPMRARHRAGHGEWIGATEPTTMGVSRTVREQARIIRAAQIAKSNERVQPHFRYPYSLP